MAPNGTALFSLSALSNALSPPLAVSDPLPTLVLPSDVLLDVLLLPDEVLIPLLMSVFPL